MTDSFEKDPNQAKPKEDLAKTPEGQPELKDIPANSRLPLEIAEPEPSQGQEHTGGQLKELLPPSLKNLKLPTTPIPLLLCALGAGILFFRLGAKPKVPTPAEVDPFEQASVHAHMPDVDYHRASRAAVTSKEIHNTLNRVVKKSRTKSPNISPAKPQDQKVAPPVAEPADKLADKPLKEQKKAATRKKRVSPKKAPKKPYKARRFLGPGGDLPFFKEPQPKEPQLKLALATRIPAILDMGITSVHATTVLARTSAPIHTSEQIIPKGTIITGRATGAGPDRLFVKFNRLVLDGQSYKFTGVATVAHSLGIPAIVHKQDLENRTGAKLAEGALETLKGLTSAAARHMSHGTIRGTDGVIDEAQREHEIDRSKWLEVPAGTSFSIVITGD